jgi:predicted NAD-dependent protein-ADP-ribosyltransferase YbiA (DUF1768 family)
MGPIRSTPSAMFERPPSKSPQSPQAERLPGMRRTIYDPNSPSPGGLPRAIARVPSRIRSRSKSLQENFRRTLNTAVGRSHRQTDSPQSAVSAPVLGSSSHPFPKMDKDVDHNSPKPVKTRSPSSSPVVPSGRILFYNKHEPYYGFTNFSPHAVYYHNKSYPTSEHLFQSLKVVSLVRVLLVLMDVIQFAHRPNLAEHIRTCDPRPSKAFSEARRFQPEVRADWKEVNVKMVGILPCPSFDHNLTTFAISDGSGPLS